RWRRRPPSEARNSTRPPRTEAGGSTPSSSRRSLLAAGSGAGEQLAEYGVDLARRRHAPHGEVGMHVGDLAVAGPCDALHGRDLRFGHHLNVGEVLADGQDLPLQHRYAALHVVVEVVTVGGLRGIDVPIIRRIALVNDPQHL